MYVKKYFKEDSKKIALEMVTDIREEFNIILKNLDWMDDETRYASLFFSNRQNLSQLGKLKFLFLSQKASLG